jgi:hypothetical protein
MHTDYALTDDLVGSERFKNKLLCVCNDCFECDLRSWLITGNGYRGFKETTLFSELEVLKEWIPLLKIIYIVRDIEHVVRSYRKRNLFNKWEINDRKITDIYKISHEQFIGDTWTDQESFVRWMEYKRRDNWNKLGSLFTSIQIYYEDLITDPISELKSVEKFLGLKGTSRQRQCVESRTQTKSGSRHDYGTFSFKR